MKNLLERSLAVARSCAALDTYSKACTSQHLLIILTTTNYQAAPFF
jgi:hypothetical protein